MVKLIKLHEGYSPQVYVCPAGARTIGYGHNIDAHPIHGVSVAVTRERAEQILSDDIARATRGLANALPYFADLGPVRQAVLVDMTFNLGLAGLLRFRRMLGHVQTGHWTRAAAEMLASRWYEQVGDRASRLAKMMLSGTWPAELSEDDAA